MNTQRESIPGPSLSDGIRAAIATNIQNGVTAELGQAEAAANGSAEDNDTGKPSRLNDFLWQLGATVAAGVAVHFLVRSLEKGKTP